MAEHSVESDPLGTFIAFADKVMALRGPDLPAYTETCACGGSVNVGREVPPAERKKIHAYFVGRHRECVTQSAETGSTGSPS